MLVDRGQTHRPMAEKEDKRGLQALAERSTGRRLMLSLGRSSTMSAAHPALEERRMGPLVLLAAKRLSEICRLHRGPYLIQDIPTQYQEMCLLSPEQKVLTVLRVAVEEKHPVAEGIMAKTARMCPRTLADRAGRRINGSLTITHPKIYASMVVEQAVEPPMGKTETPAATVQRQSVEQERLLMHLKRRTK